MADIHKIAALCIRDKKLLIVHKKTINLYITLGGKKEPHETELQCLHREVKEEIQCTIKNPIHFGTFNGTTFDNKTLQQSCYLCELEGPITIRPEDNIDDITWISNDYTTKNLPLAPMLKNVIIPELIRKGLL